jgi:hypothetical protein
MKIEPGEIGPDRTPLGIPWAQWIRWALFISANTVIATIVLVGVGAKKPWLWEQFFSWITATH